MILVNAKHGELLEMIIMLDDDMIKFLVLLNTRGVTMTALDTAWQRTLL